MQSGTSVGDQNGNSEKAIHNLMKEHNKLKKRIELLQQPNFLVNLKRDLRVANEEINQQ